MTAKSQNNAHAKEPFERILAATDNITASAVCWIRLDEVRKIATEAIQALTSTPENGQASAGARQRGEEMMASLEKVSKQYRGKMASGYDAKRLKQKRWHEENRIVEEMLRSVKNPGLVLDCPVGTGRFLELYDAMKLRGVGVDSSDQMLAEAKRKKVPKSFELVHDSADALEYKDDYFRTCVSVRFFNLLPPDALRLIFAELTRVTSTNMICTVRLGPTYYSNSAMATHDEKAWWRMVRKHGWEVARDETEPFVKGWHLMLLRRK